MIIVKKPNILETIRIKNGYSRYALSLKAGISKLSVSRIEKGEVNPTPKTAKKICEALNVDFDELFTIKCD